MCYGYRIKYMKNGPLKFISHLDLNALFCRTLRRTQIPVELTQGYNPRFKVSFGPALPLGIAGQQEFLDIFLEKELDNVKIKEKINKTAPIGLTIKEVQKVTQKDAPLSQSLRWAVYIIFLELNVHQYKIIVGRWEENIRVHIRNFLDKKNILVEKKTKKGFREVNLRPYIQNLEFISGQDEKIVIRLIIDIQYKGSINPYLVMNEFIKQLKNEKIHISKVIREQLIIDGDGNI